MHSPEFLREAHVHYDVRNPDRNIIGIPVSNDEYKKRAREVIDIFAKAPFESVCNSYEAELIKYAGNCYLYSKVVFMNMLYDLASAHDCNWNVLKEALMAEPRIGDSHLDPVHDSGRGAGGHCFIKDFAAFRENYEKSVGDKEGVDLLKGFERKNIKLMRDSNKNPELLEEVYGNTPEL